MNNCVFAGTFDPVTKGHKNIIEKCVSEYHKVFVVVGENPNKKCFFTREERLNLLKECFKNNSKIEVLAYNDYKEDYAKFLVEKGVSVYARGIRNGADLEFEKDYEEINKKLYPFIATRYIECDEEFKNISSSSVKEEMRMANFDNIPNECLSLLEKILTTKIMLLDD